MLKRWVGCGVLAGLLVLAGGQPAAAADAEVIAVTGTGERRDHAQADWLSAAPKHRVPAGGFVRTGDLSSMALLLPDRTQLRLNQNSQMQIKSAADSTEWGQSAVRLNSGRAWSQARPRTAPDGRKVPDTRVTMETPAVTLSIRGTDWEVEVGADGRTQLVVLSGTVNIANEQGRLDVGPGEAATAAVGQAPVRLLLANPQDRVQWVTLWRPQPRRWLPSPQPALTDAVTALERGHLADAARRLEAVEAGGDSQRLEQIAILRADLLAAAGELASAAGRLSAGVRSGQPGAQALLARVEMARGDLAAAREVLRSATVAFPGHVELALAQGDLAILEGDADAARRFFERALATESGNADAWLGLGRIDTERENLRAAGRALAAALVARSEFAEAAAERATLATLAGDLTDAHHRFDAVLAQMPDNYTALTGRGLLRLKSGDSDGALEDFLRAGVLEPRFARAWLYSAAAFYQQGEPERARQALEKAATLDPRDPLPHVLRGLMAADALDLGGAADAAREAQRRMPFLKSLNQVLNNQKGSANVGSALASFGLEAWARHYAALAYSPWWAGSHLFLADRESGGFNKNSELFKGFVTDPTVFGASQRHSSLLPSPGRHGRVDLFLERADWRQAALIGTVNGLSVEPFPLAYFVSGDLSESRSREAQDGARGGNVTVGLGARPGDAVGVFGFATQTRIDGRLDNAVIADAPLSIEDARLDLGLNVRLDSRNQLWFKAGSGRSEARLRGTVSVPDVSPAPLPLDRFDTVADQADVQFRHAFALRDDVWLGWGVEFARQRKPAFFELQASPRSRLAITERNEVESRDVYGTIRGPLRADWLGELAAFSQHVRAEGAAESRVNGALIRPRTEQGRDFSELNWRGGLQWQYAPQSRLTGVHQTWRRPAGVATLAPIDTLGIAHNDRLVSVGGWYRRARLQVDHEVGENTFVQSFVDRETVRNLTSPLSAVVPDLQLDQLNALRNRRDAFTALPDLEETPAFLEGVASTLGLTLNQRLRRDQTLAVRYLYSEARQTGAREGLMIPFMPKHFLRLGAYWSLPDRWLVGTTATWRSERFSGEANTSEQRIEAGWVFGLSAYWESADKRWVIQGILDNLRVNRQAAYDSKSRLTVRASYLF